MPFVARRLVASVLSLSVAILGPSMILRTPVQAVGRATAAAVQASGMTVRAAIWAAHGP
jgi:hypothetical protein